MPGAAGSGIERQGDRDEIISTQRERRPRNPGVPVAGSRTYRVIRGVVSFALRRFYRIERAGPPLPGGPLLLVGNHPNALIDPALLIAVSTRPLTFLAKEPIFRMPLLGSLVRALGALPVVRAQDDPRRMRENLAALAQRRRDSPAGGRWPSSPRGEATPNRRSER